MAYFARQQQQQQQQNRTTSSTIQHSQRRHGGAPGHYHQQQEQQKQQQQQPPVKEEPKIFEGKGEETGGMEGKARTEKGDPVTRKTLEALSKLKLVLKKRGAHGIITLGKKFKSMDDNGDGTLCYEEFKKAMNEMKFNEGEMQALFRFFDADCNGCISYNEFITGLRGELNDRRKELVFMAYKVMDKNGDGKVDMQDMVTRYDASQHPDVISGKKTKMEVIREFMDVFDGGVKDGVISPLEFAQYYSSVSANIDDDDYFELMIRNAWHISGGEGWCENTTNRRVLVTHDDGTQTIEEIKDDIDIGKNDTEAMKANLAEQGIKAANIDTTGNVNQETPPQKSSDNKKDPHQQPIAATQPDRRHRSDLYGNRAKQTQSSIIF